MGFGEFLTQGRLLTLDRQLVLLLLGVERERPEALPPARLQHRLQRGAT
jgi:hypothetical protein